MPRVPPAAASSFTSLGSGGGDAGGGVYERTVRGGGGDIGSGVGVRGAHPGDVSAVVVEAARAIQSNQTEALGQLLGRRGLPVDAADQNHDTLLSLACQLGRRRATKTLLCFGADVNSKNKQGLTPVDHCVENGHFTLADYLVKWAEKHGVLIGEQ